MNVKFDHQIHTPEKNFFLITDKACLNLNSPNVGQNPADQVHRRSCIGMELFLPEKKDLIYTWWSTTYAHPLSWQEVRQESPTPHSILEPE